MNPQSASPVPGVTVLTQELLPEPVRGAPEAKPSASRNLLDDVLEATGPSGQSASLLQRFLRESHVGEAIRQWLGPLPSLSAPALRQFIAQHLNRDIARLDALLNGQVNAILHHPEFQKLEASWRSLRFLVDQTPEGSNVKIRVLNVSWKELTRDLTVRSLEFDQSQLFRKVYSEEFGAPGGEPFGVLLGDYEIRHKMSADHPYNDVETLGAIAGVAAAAFAPFIAASHPTLLELGSFSELERPLNLTGTFEHLDYLKWKAFRKSEDSRFVGLTLPHVLVRLPYVDDNARTDGFRFREEVGAFDRRNYLWGNAAYAFGAVLIRAFVDSGWLADIRGARRGELGGGVVDGLPVHSFRTDRNGSGISVTPRSSTDTIITDAQEKELGLLGFIPLCYCQDTELSAFYGNQSVQEPQEYDKISATTNARMSAMLQYILCASRFAHYLKVIGRDRIGAFTTAADFQHYLRSWLTAYTTSNDKAAPDLKARYPLREGRVEIEELSDKPGTYGCRIFLRPHYQLDQLASVLRLESTLAPTGPTSKS
jgi:type VI secretion system ImpC/EvpB family protein